jgi:hypothetical protein
MFLLFLSKNFEKPSDQSGLDLIHFLLAHVEDSCLSRRGGERRNFSDSRLQQAHQLTSQY